MQKYQDSIRIILKEPETTDLYKSSNEIYYKILVDEVGQWFKYQDNRGEKLNIRLKYFVIRIKSKTVGLIP
ncbi:hypothetical protein AGMMS50239_06280 [Bacteroidia bacterium]|nr:hypothetical protein AGMMS50239_06280 [Bacteroidia bacterium]